MNYMLAHFEQNINSQKFISSIIFDGKALLKKSIRGKNHTFFPFFLCFLHKSAHSNLVTAENPGSEIVLEAGIFSGQFSFHAAARVYWNGSLPSFAGDRISGLSKSP